MQPQPRALAPSFSRYATARRVGGWHWTGSNVIAWLSQKAASGRIASRVTRSRIGSERYHREPSRLTSRKAHRVTRSRDVTLSGAELQNSCMFVRALSVKASSKPSCALSRAPWRIGAMAHGGVDIWLPKPDRGHGAGAR